jgi:hypothetical protein
VRIGLTVGLNGLAVRADARIGLGTGQKGVVARADVRIRLGTGLNGVADGIHANDVVAAELKAHPNRCILLVRGNSAFEGFIRVLEIDKIL